METEIVTEYAMLADRIRSRTARVGVVGLGYVGLPLAVEFAAAGFSVTGIDVQESKVAQVNAGRSYVQDIPTAVLGPLVQERKLRATTDFSVIAGLDTVNICVPTPLRKTKDPDMSYIVPACQQIARYVHPGMLITLESTTYPGTTDELVRPMLEGPELRVGQELFLCFSPERVDPGNANFQTRNIPKAVGGVTPECTEPGRLFYSQALEQVVPVGSTQAAEMVKPVYPGPGLGGHCIPIDPFYLSWKSRQSGVEARFIELAGYINGQMPGFVVDKIQNALNEQVKPLRG